jgi:hypothetical protein
MSDKLNEMWQALEAHKPTPGYAEAWATMLKERTWVAASAAAQAARTARTAAAAAQAAQAAEAAAWAVVFKSYPTDAEEAALADEFAQEAIDAIKEVKP